MTNVPESQGHAEVWVIERGERDGALVLAMTGRVDSTNAGAVEAAMLRTLEGGAQKVVLDMSDLEYISSAGLRIVLVAAKRLKQVGGRFALWGLRPSVHEVFAVSGFLSFLVICESEGEAIRRVVAA